MNLMYDQIQVVFELDLKLLVVTPALVRGPHLEDFGKTVEYLAFPSVFLVKEFLGVLEHKLEVD
jgi:hypothetical protein